METRKIKPDKRKGAWQRGCTTEITYPRPARDADGVASGTIERIERSCSTPGHVASMHVHRDEEILTCIRAGTILHIDSMGHEEKLCPGRVMLVDAGATFYHEERTLGRDPVNGYQIYFRPRRHRLEPAVQFLEPGLPTLNEWRLLASEAGTPLVLRSQADVYDGRFTAGSHHFPMEGTGMAPRILLVFEGTLRVGGERFQAVDILALAAEDRTFQIDAAADLLLIHDRAKFPATSRR